MWCWHKWKEESRHRQNILDKDNYILRVETLFLIECEKCKEKKIQKLEGNWANPRKDDDDYDEKSSSPAPQMTPDDFYASLKDER